MPAPLTKQRARNESDKERRRAAIVEAARRVLGRVPYAELTVLAVGRQAGLAKGTVYLYFRTKEELALAVFEEELAGYVSALVAELAARARVEPEELARLVVSLLEARPLFLHLTTVLHGVLEKNVSLDAAVQFKQRLLAQLARGGAELERCLPFLAPGEGTRVFLRAYAMLVGLWQLADHSPVVRQAIESQQLHRVFDIDFAAELESVLVVLLRGMQARQEDR